MAKRPYTLTVRCTEPNCTECSHYSYDTKKEYNEGYLRHKNFKCTRHSNPDKVLSIENKKNVTELVNTKSEKSGFLFWATNGKLGSSFNYSDTHRAWSKDFPEGTILRITAEIVFPKKF